MFTVLVKKTKWRIVSENFTKFYKGMKMSDTYTYFDKGSWFMIKKNVCKNILNAVR